MSLEQKPALGFVAEASLLIVAEANLLRADHMMGRAAWGDLRST
jgi:hypothetical protein